MMMMMMMMMLMMMMMIYIICDASAPTIPSITMRNHGVDNNSGDVCNKCAIDEDDDICENDCGTDCEDVDHDDPDVDADVDVLAGDDGDNEQWIYRYEADRSMYCTTTISSTATSECVETRARVPACQLSAPLVFKLNMSSGVLTQMFVRRCL